MPSIRANGISIHVDDSGSGEAVLFAHAYLGRADVWAGQRIALNQRYRVIAFDARGHGRSDAPSDPDLYMVEHAIGDIIGVLDALGVDRAHLCGLSMGAETVLHTLLRHPERVITATTADVGTGSDDPAKFNAACNELARSFLDHGTTWTFENHLADSEFVLGLGQVRDRAIEGMRKLVESQRAEGLAYSLRGIISDRPTIYEIEPQLRAITRPVQIIRGELDAPVTNPARFMADVIPGAREVVIPGVGHITNIQAPALFNRALREFLAAHPETTRD